MPRDSASSTVESLQEFRPGGGHLSGQVGHLDGQRLHRVQFGVGDARNDKGVPDGAVGAGAPRPGGEFRRFEPGRGIGSGRQGRVQPVHFPKQPQDDFPVALVPRIGGGGVADREGIGFNDFARGIRHRPAADGM